ncbi:glycosyltransferase family 4 protein [Candidatus Woesearchaeota archaeon]|nr:glycosyltransferase family 4 protein [Candidatus Woesearchaeota archaeon]
MRIVLYPYNFHGGTAIYIVELAAYLKGTGHRAYVIGEQEGKEGNLTFIRQPLFPGGRIIRDTPLSYLLKPIMNQRIAAIINRINPDLVISSGFLYGVDKRIPIVQVGWDYPRSVAGAIQLARRYSSGLLCWYKALREIESSITDRLFPTRNELTACVSSVVARKLAERGEHAIYLPPGIMPMEHKYAKYPRFTICFVAKNHIWVERKGLHHLLDALLVLAREHPELRWGLQVIGNVPPDSATGFRKYHDIREHITVAGPLPREKSMEIVARSHLFAAPSLYDEFGYAVLEALMLGTPVIASQNESFMDMVTPECGVITDTRHPALFAEQIARLIRDKRLSRQMGRNARQRAVQEYSWEKVMGRIRLELRISA